MSIGEGNLRVVPIELLGALAGLIRHHEIETNLLETLRVHLAMDGFDESSTASRALQGGGRMSDECRAALIEALTGAFLDGTRASYKPHIDQKARLLRTADALLAAWTASRTCSCGRSMSAPLCPVCDNDE